VTYSGSTRHASRLPIRMVVPGLAVIVGLVGCGDNSGPDPSIKVEQGKTIEESVRAKPGAVKKHEPAPIQRTKSRPE
jgi:hypothetical protein